MMRPQRIQAGDTIIEVMLAMALLTAFLFISWGITNKATQIGINSQKRIEMVSTMKEQAELIKAQYAREDYTVNGLIKGSVASDTSDLLADVCSSKPTDINKILTIGINQLNPKELAITQAAKSLPDAQNSVWIQWTSDNPSNPKYYDFYVRACWQTVGSAQNTDSSQFVVRLNTNAP